MRCVITSFVLIFSFLVANSQVHEVLDYIDKADNFIKENKTSEAIEVYEKAIIKFKDQDVDVYNNYGLLIYELGNLYYEIGQYNKALPLHLEELEIAEKAIGRNHKDYSVSLGNLALLYQKIGDYGKALPLLIESLEIKEKTVGKEDESYGIALNNLAGVYAEIGDYEKALLLYMEALKNTEKTLGKEHHEYGLSLNNLALLYKEIGDYGKALPLYIEALEIIEKTLGKEDDSYGITLNNLAAAYAQIGDYEKALPLHIQELEIAEKTLGKDHYEYSVSLNNLALLYKEIGDYKKALPLYLESLKKTEKTLGKEHHEYGVSSNNLALLYQSIGEYDKMLIFLKKYNGNTLNRIERNFVYQTAREKQNYITNIIGAQGLNHFLIYNYLTNNSNGEALSLALNNILTSKGLVLNATKDMLSDLTNLNNEVLNDSIKSFISKRSYITRQLQLPIRDRKITLIETQEDLINQERFLLNTHKKHFKNQEEHVKDFKNTKLKDKDIAIEFTHFDVYNKKWTDSTMYVAYLYKKDWDIPKVVNLFEEEELRDYFERYSSRGSIAISKKSNEKVAISELLYEMIWQPLEPYLKDVETIYYSPDGFLHKVPINALPTNEGRFLGEIYDLNRVSNTASINVENEFPNLTDALLLGDITYNYSKDSTTIENESAEHSILKSKELLGNDSNKNRNTRSGSWDYLPGTKVEIDYIKTQLPKSETLSKENATETAFKQLSGKSPSIVHISTHGFFFPDLKEENNNNSQNEEQTYELAKDPLLRSGLILANANYAWQNGSNPYEKDDGILTALEISNLDLRNTDIVILSACETGLGDIPSSEGVYGLQRAFKMAGVNTIIMTLWEVPDKETAEFMKKFYTKWKAVENPKQAFKYAQNYMMKKYRYQPDKWAAFVLFE